MSEVPSNVKEDLAHIREWISQQPHLIARTDDRWLYMFLRGCKFSLQRTKAKIEKYYTLKTALPEFFENRDPLLPEIQDILDVGLFLPLPKIENSRSLYFFNHCKFADYENIQLTDVLKMFIMITDAVFIEDLNNEVDELYILCDLDGLQLHHLIQATPTLCKKITTFLRDGFPGRPQGFYLLNAPSIFEPVLTMVKPLLGKKLSSRIKICTLDTIRDNIPLSTLPKDFGGEGKSIDELKIEWKQKVESCRDWFLEDGKYGCCKGKRVEAIPYSELFGIEGSFKKLSID